MNERRAERRKSDTNIPNKVAVSRRPTRHSTTAAPQLERLAANSEITGSVPKARRYTHPTQLRTSDSSKATWKQTVSQPSGNSNTFDLIAESYDSMSPRSKDELPSLSAMKSSYEEHRQKLSSIPKDKYTTIGLPKVEQAEKGKGLRSPVNVINSKQGFTLEEDVNTLENNETTKTKIIVDEKPARKLSKDEEFIEARNRRKDEREIKFYAISNASEGFVDEKSAASEINTHLSGLKGQSDTNGNISIHGSGGGQIDDRVKAFLLRPQPQKSHCSLRTKKAFELFSRENERHNRSKMEIRRERMIINNNTCPDMSLFDERKWYYQDKSGKCRYLRVPETPPPPVESIFDCLHGKDD